MSLSNTNTNTYTQQSRLNSYILNHYLFYVTIYMIKKDSRIVVQRNLCRFFFQYKIHENHCIVSSIFIINNTNQEVVGNKKSSIPIKIK